MNLKLAITPPLDPAFMPASIWRRAFERKVSSAGSARECELIFRRPDGDGFTHRIRLFVDAPECAELNYKHLERTVKLLLWQKGATSVMIAGEPGSEAGRLRGAFATDGARFFDQWFFGEKV